MFNNKPNPTYQSRIFSHQERTSYSRPRSSRTFSSSIFSSSQSNQTLKSNHRRAKNFWQNKSERAPFGNQFITGFMEKQKVKKVRIEEKEVCCRKNYNKRNDFWQNQRSAQINIIGNIKDGRIKQKPKNKQRKNWGWEGKHYKVEPKKSKKTVRKSQSTRRYRYTPKDTQIFFWHQKPKEDNFKRITKKNKKVAKRISKSIQPTKKTVKNQAKANLEQLKKVTLYEMEYKDKQCYHKQWLKEKENTNKKFSKRFDKQQPYFPQYPLIFQSKRTKKSRDFIYHYRNQTSQDLSNHRYKQKQNQKEFQKDLEKSIESRRYQKKKVKQQEIRDMSKDNFKIGKTPQNCDKQAYFKNYKEQMDVKNQMCRNEKHVCCFINIIINLEKFEVLVEVGRRRAELQKIGLMFAKLKLTLLGRQLQIQTKKIEILSIQIITRISEQFNLIKICNFIYQLVKIYQVIIITMLEGEKIIAKKD